MADLDHKASDTEPTNAGMVDRDTGAQIVEVGGGDILGIDKVPFSGASLLLKDEVTLSPKIKTLTIAGVGTAAIYIALSGSASASSPRLPNDKYSFPCTYATAQLIRLFAASGDCTVVQHG
ncbi:MAG: hypothetical protein LLG00_13450 [Planctomycetaceae bacterium]|nr:hypothetical protein [Planctomycetaceae bacterium]